MKPNQAITRAKSAAKLAWRAIILIANLKLISFQIVKSWSLLSDLHAHTHVCVCVETSSVILRIYISFDREDPMQGGLAN